MQKDETAQGGPSLANDGRRALGGRLADKIRRLGVYGGLLILMAIAAIFQPALLGPGHLLAITKVASVLGIAALGQTFVTVSRGFDISQGGLITLTIVLANTFMNGQSANIAAGVGICLLVGILIGVVNGVIVTFLRVPSIVATLGTYSVTLGGAVIYSGGVPRGSIPQSFRFIGQGEWFGIPVSTEIWVALTAVAAIYLHRTVAGRAMFARGVNEAAAHQSGINVRWYGTLPYILSSFGATLAGLVFAAYMGLPDLQAGSEYMLAPIAAAVVGGTSLAGGEGTMLGTTAGAFFLTLLSALIVSFNMPEGIRMIATGLIIILAIYFSHRENT